MAKKRIRVTAKTSDFAFITDVRLRGDVEDALYFTAYLIDAGDKTRLNRYKEEFYRATVLYIASVIEALCLFFIDNKKLVGTKHEYKYERPLNFPPISLTEGELICAIKVKRNLALKDIPFFEAIKILEQNNLFPKQLAKKINRFAWQEIHNTSIVALRDVCLIRRLRMLSIR